MTFRVTNFVKEGRYLKVFVRDCAYKHTFHLRYQMNPRREVYCSGRGGIPAGMSGRADNAQEHVEDFLEDRQYTVVSSDEWLEAPWVTEGTGINTAATGIVDYLEQMNESHLCDVRDWIDERLDGDSE
jgi:hypothetical protein